MKRANPLHIVVPVGLSSKASGCGYRAEDAAVALACQMRDKAGAGDVIAVGFGHPAGEEAVLAALARGADRAVVITPDKAIDPRALSQRLSALAEREKPDVILFGDVAIDDPASQIAPRVAAIFGRPCATGVYAMEVAGGKTAIVQREADGIFEELELALPAVVSVSLEIAAPGLHDQTHPVSANFVLGSTPPDSREGPEMQQRAGTAYQDARLLGALSLYDIVAARSKPIKRVKAASLATAPPAGYTVLSTERAMLERKRRMVASVDELITALEDEAHVI